jgi:hypothetical protein
MLHPRYLLCNAGLVDRSTPPTLGDSRAQYTIACNTGEGDFGLGRKILAPRDHDDGGGG